MKAYIHVNRQIIDHNRKHGTKKPVITIKEGKKNTYCKSVDIRGDVRIVYSPDKPLSCGAKVWIETDSKNITKIRKR